MPGQPGRGQRRDLAVEDRPALRVFVAQINVDVGGLDHPGGDQHAFEKAVRVGFEKIAVLEGAGLALVAIDREQARGGLLAHQTPFAPGRKPGTTEPAQPRMLERLDHLLGFARAGETGLQQAVAARRTIGIEADEGRDRGMGLAGGDRGGNRGGGGMLVQRVADRHHRRAIAAAHAGRPHHPHRVAEPALQAGQQSCGAGEFAAEAVAHPHRYRRRRALVVHDDVEMGVERGDLVDLDQGEAHLLGQRRHVARVEAAEMVLQQVQMLDQEVAPALALAEQRAHFVECRRVDLPALRMVEPAPPPGARMNAAVVPRLGVQRCSLGRQEVTA